MNYYSFGSTVHLEDSVCFMQKSLLQVILKLSLLGCTTTLTLTFVGLDYAG